jgi:hypothetical protein
VAVPHGEAGDRIGDADGRHDSLEPRSIVQRAVVTRHRREIARVDTESVEVVRRYRRQEAAGCIAVGFGSLWVANLLDSTV